MSNVQYGISPLTWTNDDMPELGGDIPLETCLSEMAEAGFTGTELGTKYPREPEVLIPLLEKHGLVLASGLVQRQSHEADCRRRNCSDARAHQTA